MGHIQACNVNVAKVYVMLIQLKKEREKKQGRKCNTGKQIFDSSYRHLTRQKEMQSMLAQHP